MNHQTYQASAGQTELSKAIAKHARQRLEHRLFAPTSKDVAKPCRVSYGWCFVHMAKELPPEPVVAVGQFQIARSNELEIDLRDVHPEVVSALTDPTWGIDAEPVGFKEVGGDD
jgi:hypothetical protein